MTTATQMLQARTDERGVDHAVLGEAIDALGSASLSAVSCADACLFADVPIVACAQSCADAADVAATTARVLSRTGPTALGSRSLVDAAAVLMSECAAVCETHADHHVHCRLCSDACRRAQRALASLQAEIASAG